MQVCFGYVTGTIQDLYVLNCNIHVENYAVMLGGIAGVGDGCILRCSASGNIISKPVGDSLPITFVGGIVGNVSLEGQDPLIDSCYNETNISASCDREAQSDKWYDNVYIGGIAGALQCKNATISNCYNKGNLFGTTLLGIDVGGIVGLVGGSVSVSDGVIDAPDSIIALMGGSIKNSYNIGTVERKWKV